MECYASHFNYYLAEFVETCDTWSSTSERRSFMKPFAKALVLAFLLSTFGTVLASRAETASCPGNMPSEQKFFSEVTADHVFTLTPEGQRKFMAGYGAMSKQTMPVNAKLYFAALGPVETGAVIMSGGCTFPRSIERISSAMLASLFQEYAVTAEEIIEFPMGELA
jgi:hypothetical protein